MLRGVVDLREGWQTKLTPEEGWPPKWESLSLYGACSVDVICLYVGNVQRSVVVYVPRAREVETDPVRIQGCELLSQKGQRGMRIHP